MKNITFIKKKIIGKVLIFGFVAACIFGSMVRLVESSRPYNHWKITHVKTNNGEIYTDYFDRYYLSDAIKDFETQFEGHQIYCIARDYYMQCFPR